MGWTKIKLGKLGKTFTGLSGKTKDDFGSGKPYIPYMNVFANLRINPHQLGNVQIKKGETQNQVKYGDLFFTTSSETIEEVGMTAVLLDDIGEAYLNSFCFGFRLNDFEILLPEFAPYLFRSQENRHKISLQGQGSTRYNLSKTELLEKLVLNIPSKPEQTRIAQILSKADEAIAQTEALIAKYQRIKTGLMQDLLTSGIDEHGNIRSKQTHRFVVKNGIEVPEEWEVNCLDSFCSIHNNLRKPISSLERFEKKGNYPYYGATGIIDYIDEFRVEGKYVLIGEDGDHFLKFEKQNMTHLVNGKFNVSNHAHILRGKENCMTEWVHYFFCNRDITYYLTRQGAGRFKLNKATLVNLPMCVPIKKDEQERIIEKIVGFEKQFQNIQNYREKLQALKTGLMQDLLSGRVRVKVTQ